MFAKSILPKELSCDVKKDTEAGLCCKSPKYHYYSTVNTPTFHYLFSYIEITCYIYTAETLKLIVLFYSTNASSYFGNKFVVVVATIPSPAAKSHTPLIPTTGGTPISCFLSLVIAVSTAQTLPGITTSALIWQHRPQCCHMGAQWSPQSCIHSCKVPTQCYIHLFAFE